MTRTTQKNDDEDVRIALTQIVITHLPARWLLFVQLPLHTRLIEDLLKVQQIA